MSKATSSSKVYLDRAAILAVPDILTEEVEIPEWGTYVRVRGLTAAQRDRYEISTLDQRGKNTKVVLRDARAKLVVLSVVDDAGQRVFSDDDIPVLREKSAAALDRIFEVATRLSGISDADMEELSGNSPNGHSDDSPFASP